ncbi:hypothetical protein GOP47_0009105 [Adiantum capillus-veneris]|uniref:Protein kinase domain-containing protein n=1 Tax=Adiantum capillus-veneris TaxID=13818 RepID=A0A9D4UZL1_ADICA|nr:hypothetical protein GOP47_0009105 [Adiantum capillus-veneris]
MAFFIADNKKAPNGSYGRFLGLVDPNAPNSSRFFAVEFDTHQTLKFADPSSSHIGININSLKSSRYLDSKPPAYPELFLYNNYTFTAWIEYDAGECHIKVWMSNSTSASRPPSPCLNLTHNLPHVFQDYMYVGFSATSNASNDSMEGLVLNAWNFTLYPPVSSGRKTKLIVVPLVVIVFAVLLLYTVLCTSIPNKLRKLWGIMLTLHKRNANIDTSFEQHVHHPALRKYSYNELKLACGDFDIANEIGRGAFSIVYKATLLNGQTVAIKKLKEGCRIKDLFSAELKVISTLRHKNLLPLLGWCYQEGGSTALLVYEYMSKGSLHHLLSKGTLSSEVRLEILAGVASALEYLHAHAYSSTCVVHRDVKAANVLLTDKFKAVLGDFGLACLICNDDSAGATTAMGSLGYVAPEVLQHKKATDKSDVYSYGVLVLVVATGRPAVARGPMSSTSVQPVYDTVVNWVRTKNELMEALDLRMCEGMADSERIKWRQVLQMGLTCLTESPEVRPQMSEISKAFQEGGSFSWTHLPQHGLHIFSHCKKIHSFLLFFI